MDDSSTQPVRSIRDVREQVESLFAEWIQIIDYQNEWTIDDFPYDTGVPDKVENHCWKCVTVNYCCFVNQQNKKPEEFNDDKYSDEQISNNIRGLYHPHCECKKLAVSAPNLNNVKIIALGKFNDFFTRKKGTYNSWGYSDDDSDKEEFTNVFSKLVKECYCKGQYELYEHNKYGYNINFPIDMPGKGIKKGHIYKIYSGWIIFPNGSVKANTIFAKWREKR